MPPQDAPPPDPASRGEAALKDLDDAILDAGLRAAFGETQAVTRSTGVLATLEDTVGACSRILLREDPDAGTPIVRPSVQPSGRSAGGSYERAPPGREAPRYQVLGEIARGGVGVVLKGRDLDLGRDVAMKVLRPDHRDSPSMVRRFVEEAQIAGQLQHPGILPVYELGLRDERTPFFTMKLVKGKTLAALLAQRAQPADDLGQLVAIFEQVCQTIAYAHAKGVIHRDLKPSNVLVGSFGEVQVVDWGLAKVLPQGGLADEARTRGAAPSIAIETVRTGTAAAHSLVGSVMGTPAYMAPEQARGEVRRLDERCDVFALGAMLCEILTGAPPFDGAPATALEAARRGDLAAAQQRLRACSADTALVELAHQCLAVEAPGRPRDAGALATRLAEHRLAQAQHARDLEVATARAEARAGQERRTRQVSVALAAVVLVVVVGGGATWWGIEQRAQEHRQVRSAELAGALDQAAELLGLASSTPVGITDPWTRAQGASERVATLLAEGEADAPTQARAAQFVERFARASADRQLVMAIEDAVIRGATHEDADSWLRMEAELREAFRMQGIDVLLDSNDRIANALQARDLAPQLTDGYELWIATQGHLLSLGRPVLSAEQLMARVGILQAADPDPLARGIRELLYSPAPAHAAVLALCEQAERSPTPARPRTLAWLASLCLRVEDPALMRRVFRHALLLHPDDFMLNFDCAYGLSALGAHEEVIRYALRCTAIRPHVAGVWRWLGNALRANGELPAARDALQRAVDLQADHAPSLVDLGHACAELDDPLAARRAYEEALRLRPDHAPARDALERLRP